MIPESYVARLDLPKIFGRIAALHVDLGCGDGSFLAALAARLPDTNFLGIERLAGRVEKACRKTSMLDNVRVLLAETSHALRYLLPGASVEEFYLLFPDPWPKRRHQQHRIVTPDFLNSIHTALEEGGVLRIATDQLDYFQQIEGLACNDSRFATPKEFASPDYFGVVDLDDVARPGGAGQLLQKTQSNVVIPDRPKELGDPADSGIGCPSGTKWVDLPLTKFERKFQALGASIYRLALRKVSPPM